MPRTVQQFIRDGTEAATLLAVGLNYKTAPERVRNSVAVSPTQLPDALLALEICLGNGVILSTCNRTEIYFLASSAQEGVNAITGYLSAYHNIPPAEIFPHLHIFEAEEVVQHLLRVTCSPDSMALGEAQILEQVRDAFQASVRLGLCEGVLARMFQVVLRTSKRARAGAAVGQSAGSVSSMAVELAKSVSSDLRRRHGLVAGRLQSR